MDLEELDLEQALALEPRDYLDAAIVGYGNQYGSPTLLIYDRSKLVSCFMQMNDGWTREEAEEWVSFNVDQAYVGSGTPIIMEPLDDRATSAESTKLHRPGNLPEEVPGQ